MWSRLISAKVTLGAATGLVFFALLWTNLVLADRLAPRFRSVVGPEDDLLVRYRELVAGRQRLVWLVVSVAGGDRAGVQRLVAVAAVAAVPLRRAPSASTTRSSGRTSSWYVFRLPFLTTVVDWLFAFLLVTAIAGRDRALPERRDPPAAAG